eukprot:m51a1_g46 putative sodium potassium calcium exchanger 3 (909) ;mRNA; r:158494-162087
MAGVAPLAPLAPYTPVRRRYMPEDPFFAEGSLEREAWAKRIAVVPEQQPQPSSAAPKRTFKCGVWGCVLRFSGVCEYERHYEAVHRNTCAQCLARFASPRLLELHVLEEHDSLFRAQSRTQKMYECVVPGCERRFAGPKQRGLHLVDAHGFPRSFSLCLRSARTLQPRPGTENKAENKTENAAEARAGSQAGAKAVEGREGRAKAVAEPQGDAEMDEVAQSMGSMRISYSYKLPEGFSMCKRGGRHDAARGDSGPASSGADAGGGCPDYAPWVHCGGFLLFALLFCYVFYGFALIMDEFFVPALNVFCERLGMPDDFAGATLMGLGSCAPDVFSGIIGVIILKTDVGAGTIVGSLLFNHLCILGATCLAVGNLVIDPTSLLREASFYAAALALLLVALVDHTVSVWESTALLGLYIVFVVVCGLTPRIQALLCRRKEGLVSAEAGERQPLLGASEWTIQGQSASESERQSHPIDIAVSDRIGASYSVGVSPTPTSPMSQSPQGQSPTLVSPLGDKSLADLSEMAEAAGLSRSVPVSPSPRPPRESASKKNRRRLKESAREVYERQRRERPMLSGEALGFQYGPCLEHGFLLLQSAWYRKIRVSSRTWQRRWFVLEDRFWYCRNPLFSEAENRKEIPLWRAYSIALLPDGCTFTIRTNVGETTLRAGSKEIAQHWVAALRERIQNQKTLCPDLLTDVGTVGVDDEEDSMLTYPTSFWARLAWVVALPFAVGFTFTIPNVKRRCFRKMWLLTFLAVLVWLGAMSYAMVWAAEQFACIVGIPEDIMGLSITAIGASLPSLFGSVIAARQGSAGMAVSNAFGANLSSILVALGLPYFIQTAIITPGQPVAVESNSIVTTVVVLGGALVVFMVLVLVRRFKLNTMSGVFLLSLYVALLAMVVLFSCFNINIPF